MFPGLKELLIDSQVDIIAQPWPPDRFVCQCHDDGFNDGMD